MTAAPALARLRTLAIVVVIAGSSLLTAACSGSDGDSAASASPSDKSSDSAAPESDSKDASDSETPDPCTLVTAADLQDAWGVEFNEGESSKTTPPIEFRSCGFGQTSNEPPARTLSLQVLGPDGLADEMKEHGQTVETMYESMKDMATDAEPVSLGDDGYQTGSHIGFISGDLYISLDAPGASSAEALAGLQQVAEVVASNL